MFSYFPFILKNTQKQVHFFNVSKYIFEHLFYQPCFFSKYILFQDHSWQQRQVDAAEAAKANLHSRFNNGLGVSATQLSYSKQHHYQPPHNQMQQRQQQQQRQQYQRHQQQLQQQQQRQQQQRQRQQYQSSSPQYDLPSSPVR